MGFLKKQELELQAKDFFDNHKKEIGKSLRGNEHVVHLDFETLSQFSPLLSEKLIEAPEEIIFILEKALEKTGLVNNPKIIFTSVPNHILITELKSIHLDQLLSIEGKLVRLKKLRERVVNARFECPICGAILSATQIENKDNKLHEPVRCKCGRKGLFNLLTREFSGFIEAELEDENHNSLKIYFSGENLKAIDKNIIKENNILRVIAILKEPKENIKYLDLDFVGEILNGELVRVASSNESDVENYLLALKNRGNQGAYLFEELIGKLFEKKGYEVQVTKKSGDYGIDVIAKKGVEKIAIQCKLFKKDVKVPNQEIQKALGALTSPYNANKLIFVSTAGSYTSNAIEQKSKANVDVELWNYDKTVAELKAHIYDLEEGWEKIIELEDKNNNKLNIIEETQSFDVDRIATGIPTSKRGKIITVRETISRLESSMGRLIPIEDIERELKGQLSLEEIEDCLKQLAKAGDLFKPKPGYIQKL
ncbi:MAG: restriction endonuclease [Candidatus Pacearchaeota archaeon]